MEGNDTNTITFSDEYKAQQGKAGGGGRQRLMILLNSIIILLVQLE